MHPIGHTDVEVHMPVQAGPEPVDESDCITTCSATSSNYDAPGQRSCSLRLLEAITHSPNVLPSLKPVQYLNSGGRMLPAFVLYIHSMLAILRLLSLLLPEQQQIILRFARDKDIDNRFRTGREILLRLQKGF